MYVNLHAHTAYSVLDGHATVHEYVQRVATLGHTHAAVTDHGTMSALPEFFAACQHANVSPIAGLEAYVVPGSRHVKDKSQRSAHHLTLLALDETGYRNLAKIATIGWLEGFYYSPRVDHDTLAAHSDGVICLSGCIASEISQAIIAGDESRTASLLDFYQQTYGERFFLEFQNHGQAVPDQMIVNRGLAAIARKHGIRVAATNDSHFCTMADNAGQKLLAKINNKDFGGGSPHTYVRDNADMTRAFGDTALLRNTLEIAAMTTPYALGSTVPKLPASPMEQPGETPARTLRRLCHAGLLARFDDDQFAVPAHYEVQLEYELNVIRKMSKQMTVPFERYLLVIADLARFAKQAGIRFGPRGSAAGSICCWTLGVSEVDPIAHGLYFERFLNPNRIELPDVDMDFADNRRDDVLRYLVQTYGIDQVSRIATFSQIGPKQALRDAAKVLKNELSRDYLEIADELASLVPESQHEVRLADVLGRDTEPLTQRVANDLDAQRVATAALQIAGRFRGVGTHAAGVIIGDRSLDEIVPLMTVKDDSDAIAQQTMYDGDWLPKMGLLKLDVLGLTELTKMEQTIQLIAAQTGTVIDLWRIPLDDAKTWDVICDGRTSGLFQMSKPGMTRAIRDIAPRNIDELAMICAAYRPGAIGNVVQIAERKHGRALIEVLHPALETVLAPTWGFPVFQEQVIEILVIIAGYSRGEADLVRKAIGKKIPALMAQHAATFREGAARNGYAEDAQRIWSFIEPFAGYGFNKAHAYCYAYTGYQSAWLKANYPAQFYAACMSVEHTRGGKKNDNARQRIGMLASEARVAGVTVAAPDLSAPSLEFMPRGENLIDYGLSAVKGIGVKAAQSLAQHAPYEGLSDLVLRNPTVNVGMLLTLARIGALPWGGRAEQAWRIERMVEARSKHQNPPARKGESGDDAKRRGRERVLAEVAIIADEPWDGEEFTIYDMLAWEVDALGITRSAFPRQQDIPVSGTIGDLPQQLRDHVSVVAMVLSVSPFTTRKGAMMANIVLIDDTGTIECIVWPRTWEQVASWIAPGTFVRASGDLEVLREGNHRDLDVAIDSGDAPPLSSLKLKIDSLANIIAERDDASPEPSDRPALRPADPVDSTVTIAVPDDWSYADARDALASLLTIADAHPGDQPVMITLDGIGERLSVSAIGLVRLEEWLRLAPVQTA